MVGCRLPGFTHDLRSKYVSPMQLGRFKIAETVILCDNALVDTNPNRLVLIRPSLEDAIVTPFQKAQDTD